MLNTNTRDISQARFDATAATEDHLRYHGAALCDLLDALDGETGFSTFCDLHSAFGRPVPEADAVQAALRDIHNILADQAPSTLDRIGYERKIPASDMTRWHGARVSELLARFHDAE
ncbi:hypothetical protein [Pseudosulfitobacter koreensis]|uniref:Uncharacterized protein n=1 Tax=Pseudosulfitobacter koreensis TaxID=2968472 RepID=A0ABT1Z423_9RHOB|nr:hypothetical protein [Pseudosulfitobacter koreense]MCR8827885.1 hypothetical protein [Pseudosulfitobacter koreense]